MSGKLTRAAFQQLIAEDIAWLEAQPRTLEREHVIQAVREAERYYYEDAQDEAIKAAREKALRPLDPTERMTVRGKLLDIVPTAAFIAVIVVMDEILERRKGHE